MPIKIVCPKCGKAGRAPDDHAGRRVKCPVCQTVIAVPASQLLPDGIPLVPSDDQESDFSEDVAEFQDVAPAHPSRREGHQAENQLEGIPPLPLPAGTNPDRDLADSIRAYVQAAAAKAKTLWQGLSKPVRIGVIAAAGAVLILLVVGLVTTVSSGAVVSPTNLERTARRADELVNDLRRAVTKAEEENKGNELALPEARSKAIDSGKRKIDEEFSKLRGKNIQWQFTVKEVKNSSPAPVIDVEPAGESLDFVFGRSPASGENPFQDRVLKVGDDYQISESVAKQLHPGDGLLIKATVAEVTIADPEISGRSITFRNGRPISIYLSQIQANRVKGPRKIIPPTEPGRDTKNGKPSAGEDAAACAACAGCGAGTIILAIVVSVSFIALHIALLVWVARDAKARGMDNSVLWMILVVFFGLIGLLIYIFARPQGNLIRCARCGNKRLQASRLCPHCANA